LWALLWASPQTAVFPQISWFVWIIDEGYQGSEHAWYKVAKTAIPKGDDTLDAKPPGYQVAEREIPVTDTAEDNAHPKNRRYTGLWSAWQGHSRKGCW
jgi:hypothetical protein